LYPVDGGDIDWMHDTYGVIPYVIEINATSLGFQPNYSYRDRTVEKMRPGWQYLLDQLDGSGIRGLVRHRGETVNHASVRIAQSGTELKDSRSVNPDGSFHFVLQPGEYKITVTSNEQTYERELSVGDQRVDLAIDL
jgi:hypothetical protein